MFKNTITAQGRLALVLLAVATPSLGGCVVVGVASTAVGVTGFAVGTATKVASTTVGVAANVTGATVRTVTGSGKKAAPHKEKR